MKPFSLHILTTHKNKDRHKNILDTYLNGFDDYVFYTDIKTEYGNQISCTDNDRWNSNCPKMMIELNRIFSEKLYEKYEWFVFVDDDTFVNMGELQTFLRKAEKSNSVIADWGLLPDGSSQQRVCGGCGFIINSRLFEQNKEQVIDVSFCDSKKFNASGRGPAADLYFSWWLYTLEKEPNRIQCDLLNHNTPDKVEKTDPEVMKKQLTFHYITTLDQIKNIMDTIS